MLFTTEKPQTAAEPQSVYALFLYLRVSSTFPWLSKIQPHRRANS